MTHAEGLVRDALMREDLGDLGKRLDEAEIQNPQAFASDGWPHAVHVLAFVAVNDIGAARSVADRLPAVALGQSASASLRMVEVLEKGNYGGFWRTLADLYAQWPGTHAPLLGLVADETRSSIFRAACSAFSVIGANKLAELLGFAASEEASDYACQYGATRTANRTLVLPKGLGEKRPTERDIETHQKSLICNEN